MFIRAISRSVILNGAREGVKDVKRLRSLSSFVSGPSDSSKQPFSVTVSSTGLSSLAAAARKVAPDEIQVIHSHEYDKNAVLINFGPGLQGKFTTTWLRDVCACPSCMNPLTGANLMYTADVVQSDHSIHDLTINKDSDRLFVTFNDGHMSQYSLNWLKDIVTNNYKYPLYEESSVFGTKKFPDRVLWDRDELTKFGLSVSWNEFMGTDEGARKALRHLLSYGVFFLHGTPPVKGTVLQAIRRISYEKPTVFGTTFDVVVEPAADAHIAYTSARLEHHTDLNYREKSPGIQSLHCIKSAPSGGDSFIVDGFNAAVILRNLYPEYFKLLTDNPVIFSYLDKPTNRWLREKWPVISLERGNDPGDRLREIHYNSLWMRAPLLPYDQMNAYYRAYKHFTDIMRDPKLQFKFMLEPGDLIMFNNRRVLHGRESFESKPGEDTSRHLEGCYADLDEAKSTFEKLSNL